MAFTDELFRAIADYALQFPDANSLGTNAATWLTRHSPEVRSDFPAFRLPIANQER